MERHKRLKERKRKKEEVECRKRDLEGAQALLELSCNKIAKEDTSFVKSVEIQTELTLAEISNLKRDAINTSNRISDLHDKHC